MSSQIVPRYRVPRRPWRDLIDSIAAYRASYNVEAASRDYYGRILVIHVTWDKDILPDFIPTLREQSEELQKTFSELYNYSTQRVVLPCNASTGVANDLLAEQLQRATTRLTKHDLLILHYQGHGEYSIRTKFNSQSEEEEWHYEFNIAASFAEFSGGDMIERWDKVDFTKLRETYIDNAGHDVLMLMDCCHAAAAACGPMSGKELLAATAVGATSTDPAAGKGTWGESSFTKNINHILRHAYETSNIMPTSQLFARLYTNYWTRKEIGPDVRKLDAEPVHMLLHKDLQVPIILAPLRNLSNHYRPAIDFLRDRRFPTVHVHCFTNDDRLNAKDMQDYLREKGFSGRISINGVHRVGSYWIQLEISVCTWYEISHHPDLHFVCVTGPEELNPPEFSIPEFQPVLTVRTRIAPEAIGESSKVTSPKRSGDGTSETTKENTPI